MPVKWCWLGSCVRWWQSRACPNHDRAQITVSYCSLEFPELRVSDNDEARVLITGSHNNCVRMLMLLGPPYYSLSLYLPLFYWGRKSIRSRFDWNPRSNNAYGNDRLRMMSGIMPVQWCWLECPCPNHDGNTVLQCPWSTDAGNPSTPSYLLLYFYTSLQLLINWSVGFSRNFREDMAGWVEG